MVAASVAILSLLRSRESLRHSRAGHRAERAAFSPLACVAAQPAPVPIPTTKISPGGDRQTERRSGDAASQRADVALVDQSGDVRSCGGLVDEARRKGSSSPASKAVA